MVPNADPASALSASQASRDIGRLLARVEEQMDLAAVSDRAALFHLAVDACGTREMRWAGLPIVLLDIPLDSRAEREFAAALVARAPDAFATVPEGDESCARGLGGARRGGGGGSRSGRRHAAIWPVCAVTCSRWIGLPSESGRATSGCFQRQARAGKRWRSCGASSTRPHAAFRSTRWQSSFERRSSISGCSNMPVGEAASPCISIGAPVAPIRLAARSSRCCPARRKASRRSDSTNTSRSARFPTSVRRPMLAGLTSLRQGYGGPPKRPAGAKAGSAWLLAVRNSASSRQTMVIWKTPIPRS